MKRIGSSVIVLLALVLLTLVLPDARASKKKVDAEYALVGVSVFREPGLSLPDANVTLVPDPEPGQAPVKIKKLEAISDSRGELVFRVPAAPMRYSVKVFVKGFNKDQKTVSIQGDERVDVTFLLHQESK
jgi:hypothetical protein